MVYCTGLENRQAATSQRFESFSLRKLALSHNGSAADSGSASGGPDSIWSLYGVCSSVGRVPGCGSGGRGFDPDQTPKCFNSTVVVQLTCNEQVVGSNPT